MSKVCDEDCFNCKFDDCIMDGLGRAPAPKKELKQDPRNIRRRNYWREHSEELNAKKKSSLCSAQRGDQCQEAEKDKGEKKMQIGASTPSNKQILRTSRLIIPLAVLTSTSLTNPSLCDTVFVVRPRGHSLE